MAAPSFFPQKLVVDCPRVNYENVDVTARKFLTKNLLSLCVNFVLKDRGMENFSSRRLITIPAPWQIKLRNN